MEQELIVIMLESKNLEFLYLSYPDFAGTPSYQPNNPREHYAGVAHSEQRRMLDAFYKKWKVERP